MSSPRCAAALVAQLCVQGVRDAVLAPGSRSALLALALARAEADGLLRLHVRIDERSAGYLALGLAKAGGRPVAVVTTSGTAVGNLLPAVMEAHHSGVPLVVLSADRPAALVGFGANQTTDQSRMFEPFLRWSARVSSSAPAASWPAQAARAVLLAAGRGTRAPGPVQLNVELAEPLVGGADSAGGAAGAAGRSGRPRRPFRPVHGRSWSAGTHRPRSVPRSPSWRGRAACRWSRSRPATPGRTPCAPDGCCSPGRSRTRSSGWWCSATRPCRAP
ncbi:MAG: thiamine pyrophosphate-binding protein [Micropruina sp.]